MKNKLITRLGIVWLLSFMVVGLFAQAQTLNVGTVRNGSGLLTDLNAATRVLKANLPVAASVSNVQIEFSEYDSKYYLTAKVGNSPVNSVGIQLNLNGNVIYAMAGPGIQVTCSGYKCADCKVIISKWRARCNCETPEASDTRCDMTQTTIISF